MKKKLLVSLIAVVLVLALGIGVFAACNKKKNNGGSSEISVPAYPEKTDDQTYAAVLGDFNEALKLAKAESDVDMRYALMAVAEAKMLEAGAYLPTTSQGGRYAINRLAPYSVSPVLFGTDSSRLYSTIVANKLIKTSDRDELKKIYAETKGTGTYAAKAKEYLVKSGYAIRNVYNYPYSEDPKTWDITNTNRTVDSEAIVNTYDGLIIYDAEGFLRPALAESWTVSADGLKYTFNIRQGVKWVDVTGAERYEVEANDWVYGMKRILDNKQSAELVTPLIKGAFDYAEGKEDDFSKVGVKALDKYTLEYELIEPCSYFLTLFSYNPFAPVNETYAKGQGENYGKDPGHILYNGPYRVTEATQTHKITFSANNSYWNKDVVNVQTINWICYPNDDDPTEVYNDVLKDTIDGCGLNTETIPLAKERDNIFNDYVFTSATDATAFGFFFNVKRQTYALDGQDVTSVKTENQKNLTKWALGNANFRKALSRAIDRGQYNAITSGDDLKFTNLQNMYTPGTFVSLSKAVTIKINGVDKTFKAGTFYGEIAQAQMNADLGADAPMIWNPQADGGIGASGGYDGWYNPTVAVKLLNAAIEELAAEGVTVNEQNPIHIDYVTNGANKNYVTRAQALKQNIESVFGGKVVLDIVSATRDSWLNCGYFQEEGKDMNYDVYDVSGWGPDYGDPATYLDTLMPVNGAMIKMLGIY